jgi:Protein of unknown function (DUF3301)
VAKIYFSAMPEVLSILLMAALGWLWYDSMRARERAVLAGKHACERDGLQFLDDTVQIMKLWPARNRDGRMALRRTYRFEFSDDGAQRRGGVVVMLGARVESLDLEPFLMH